MRAAPHVGPTPPHPPQPQLTLLKSFCSRVALAMWLQASTQARISGPASSRLWQKSWALPLSRPRSADSRVSTAGTSCLARHPASLGGVSSPGALTNLFQHSFHQPIPLLLLLEEQLGPGFPEHVLISFHHEPQGAASPGRSLRPRCLLRHVHAQVVGQEVQEHLGTASPMET